MPMFFAPLDLNRSELRNARTQNLAVAPSSPEPGLRYYDTVTNTEQYWNGTAWVSSGGGSGGPHAATHYADGADPITGKLGLQVGTGNVLLGEMVANGIDAAATHNTAVGMEAGREITTGGSNTAVGYRAGGTIGGGYNNVVVGSSADVGMANASEATALGAAVRVGAQATAVGAWASATGQGSVAIGTDSSSYGASAAAANEFVLGTGNHDVKVPGTVTLGKTLDLTNHEALNLVTHNLATEPATPVEGQRYYDTTTKKERYWDGTAWVDSGGAGAVTSVDGRTGDVTLDDKYVTSVDGRTGIVTLGDKYVDVTGDTMTGPLIVSPVETAPVPLQAMQLSPTTTGGHLFGLTIFGTTTAPSIYPAVGIQINFEGKADSQLTALDIQTPYPQSGQLGTVTGITIRDQKANAFAGFAIRQQGANDINEFNGVVEGYAGFRLGNATRPSWTSGNGTPEGVVTAPVGSLYSRRDGATGTAVYRKESGAAATGWVALISGGVPDDNSVTSAKIVDGSIVNADIAAGAAIDLSKLAVNPLDRANHTGTQVAATISDFNTAVRLNRLDQMAAPTATVNVSGQVVTGVAAPSAPTDAVNKAYADNVAAGLDFKSSVRVAATTAINLAAPGAAIDGITLATGNRVLVAAQATAADNGIYVWNGAAVPATRAADADTDAEVTSGLYVFVEQGTANGAKAFVLITPDPITVGTTALTFSLFSAGGASVVGTANRVTVTGTQVDIAPTYTGQASITTLGTITGPLVVSGLVQAALSTTAGGFRQGASGPLWIAGSGAPEGVVTAPIGSLFSRTNGSTGTALYRKEVGTGNTGWSAVTSGVTSVDGRAGAVTLADLYVDTTGDTMTGQLHAPVLSTGAAPAQQGAIRLTNAEGIWSRNNSASGDLRLMQLTATHVLQLGVTGTTGVGIANAGSAGSCRTLWVSHDANTTNAAGGISFGLSADTNLYRSAADVLKTDDSLNVATNLGVGASPNSASRVDIQNASTHASGFGSVALKATNQWSSAVNATSTVTGGVSALYCTAGTGATLTNAATDAIVALAGQLNIAGDGTYAAAANAVMGKIVKAGLGTVSEARSFLAFAPDAVAGGTISIATGLDIEAQKGTNVTTGYGVFQRGAADYNYFNGSVGLGVTTPTARLQFTSATTAAGGILFGTDTNLYRSTTDTLRTDDAFAALTVNPIGLAGATAASRYVGATASGSPASGTFAIGDWVVDRTGAIRVCTVAGSPGTWVSAGGTGAANTGWAVTAGYAADKALNPESSTLTECLRVLGTLIDALKSKGILAA